MVVLGYILYILVLMPSFSRKPPENWLKAPFINGMGGIYLAGRLHDSPGIDTTSMRILGNFALIVIESGSGYYRDATGRSTQLSPGDVIIVFPEIAHAYGPLGSSQWSHSYVVFNGPQFELMRRAGILDTEAPLWRLEPIEYWSSRIEETLGSQNRATQSVAIRAVAQFAYLLSDMAASHQEVGKAARNAWLEDSLHLLSSPSADRWLTPQAVAQSVGLSYENFRKRFSKETGESPAHFQKRRRIEFACAAIYQNSHSFKRLADELGFCDVFHFSKVFRQVTGETPSTFRKKALGGN